MERLIKIMMVEDDPEICADFCAAAEQYSQLSLVYQTDSQQNALDYMEGHTVDVLLLDIELTEGDGVSLLDQLQQRTLAKPFIVVVTNTASTVTLSYMRTHGADYIYQKTNAAYSAAKVLSVILKLYPYKLLEGTREGSYAVERFHSEKARVVTRQYVETELEKMGFKRSHVGFDYAAEAIQILIANKDEEFQITRALYPLIARRHHTTKDGVERGIRNAIEYAFTGTPPYLLEQYYPYPYEQEKGRPTNVEFLKNMAVRLAL